MAATQQIAKMLFRSLSSAGLAVALVSGPQHVLAGEFLAGPEARPERDQVSVPAGDDDKGGIFVLIPLPADLNQEDVARGDEGVRARLRDAARERLRQTAPQAHSSCIMSLMEPDAPLSCSDIGPRRRDSRDGSRQRIEQAAVQGEREGAIDRIVIFVDREGNPILPDQDNARREGAPARLAGLTANELTFTFNSPSHPWTTQELSLLQRWIADFYPQIRFVYGEPLYNLAINVVKVPDLWTWAAYSPSSNEIWLGPAAYTTQPDAVCHEMIHAFRDDDLIWFNSFEEGMTRAAEIEVFNRLPAYAYWNRSHSKSYDVYYESIGTQWLGQVAGDFWRGGNTTMYYDLAGYAWAKPYLQGLGSVGGGVFFADFNRELHARVLAADMPRRILWNESKLCEVLCAVMPSIEGMSCLEWYGHQGILSTLPPTGDFLVHQVYSDPMRFYSPHLLRQLSGNLTYEPGTLEWAIYDAHNVLLVSGTFVSTSGMGVEYGPPVGYAGRIKIVVTSTSLNGPIRETYFMVGAERAGIFGVVPSASSGTLTLTPPDDPPVSSPVIDGAFEVPELAAVRGEFIAAFTDSRGRSFTRRFSKDASDYFLLMAAADLETTLAPSADPAPVGRELFYTATVVNRGPSVGTGVTFYETLPTNLSLVSVLPSQGTCAKAVGVNLTGETVVCPLGIIEAGSAAIVRVMVMPLAEGSALVRARAVATEYDPDTADHSSEQVTTITPPTREYVGNPGFEKSLAGWTAASSGTSIDRVGSAHSGSYAARIRRSRSAGEGQINDHPNWQPSTTGGQTCTASAWVKGPRGLDVRIRLREYRLGERVGYNSAGIVLPDTNWHRIGVTLTVFGTGSSMDLNVYGKDMAVGRELLVDDVSEVCQ